jgi:Methane oxygenase PmoA
MRFLFLLAMVVCEPAAFAAPPVKIEKTETALVFRMGDMVVSNYVFGGEVQQEKGDGKKPLAKPYFYPLLAPNGMSVTRDWPMKRGQTGETVDHFHQKSAWFCHGDVIPEGLELKTKSVDKAVKGVDFWSEHTGHGRIVCTLVGEPKMAGDTATIETTNEWRSADGDVLLTEARKITFTATKDGYLLGLEVTFRTPIGVTFGDTKEGSMGIRIRDDFTLTRKGGTGVITSSEKQSIMTPAKDNLPIWGKSAEWHDYSGQLAGQTAGIAILDHPTNPHRAAWHTRAYGLMAANPFAREKSGFPSQKGKTDVVKLSKTDSLTLRYALYIHSGAANSVGEVYKYWK